MAFCLVYRVFKYSGISQFQATFEETVGRGGGQVTWERCEFGFTEFSACFSESVQTISLQRESNDSDFYLCSRIGSLLRCPWIDLRIQFETFWEYTLFLGDTPIDSFCTFPEYYDLGIEQTLRGRADALAENWGVPLGQIDKYLVPWVTEMREYGVFTHKKANERDRRGYGDYLQALDFLHAIGGADALGIGGGPRVGADHGLKYPPVESLV